jgi:hypothetical protein
MKIEERERVDVVVSEKDFERFSGILENEGFSRVKEADEFALTYEGRFVCYQKMVESLPVSVDLLVGMVQSRQTDAPILSITYRRIRRSER